MTERALATANKSTNLQVTIEETMSLTSIAQAFAYSGLFTDLQQINNEQQGAQAQRQSMIKILAGKEMGLEPVQAQTGLQIVEGRLSLTADTMALRVASHPNYRYRVAEHTRQVCKLVFWERDDKPGGGYEKWEEIGTSEFSIWDAEAAGLCKVVGVGDDAKAERKSQRGNPLPWQSFTRNLLFARAISNGFRWFVPHLKLASVYTPEEVIESIGSGSAETGPAPAGVPATADDLDAAVAAAPKKQKPEPVDAELVEDDDDDDDDGAGAEQPSNAPAEPDDERPTSETETADTSESDAETAEPDAGAGDEPEGSAPESSPAPPEQQEAAPAPDPTPPQTSAEQTPPGAQSGAGSEPPAERPSGKSQGGNVDYKEWLGQAGQFKGILGEERYREILEPFVMPGQEAKSNKVPPANVLAALSALEAAAGTAGVGETKAIAPSAGGLAEAQQLKKAELCEGIPALEGRIPPERVDREAYGIDSDKLDVNKVSELRIYYARLGDIMNEKPAGQKELF